MRDYVIVTDSSCDLTPSLIKEFGVHVIPLEFHMEEKQYFNYMDWSDIAPKTFYDKLRDKKLSTTNQVNMTRFAEIFEPFLKEGKDILYIGFSSALSGTYASSVMAAKELSEKYPGAKVVTVDSLAASMGQGLLVKYASDRKKQGAGIDELSEWITEKRDHIIHLFTVDDLNHLKRGGRVSSTTALVGTMLGIKPVLHVDPEGRLMPFGKTRGRARAISAMVDVMETLIAEPDGQTVYISHGDCYEDAVKLAEMIKKRFKINDIFINYVGPVIGTHSGPGTLALFFVGKTKETPKM